MQIRSTKHYGAEALKIIVYGQPGVGKTTLARTTGESTLIISAESGLLSLKGSDVDFVDISVDEDGNTVKSPKQKWDNLQTVYQGLLTPEAKAKYKWIFLDSVTEMSNILYEWYKPVYEGGKDKYALYREIGDETRINLVKKFRDLAGYNVVFLALDKQDKDENARRFTGVNIIGSMADNIYGYFDEVFYYQVAKDDEGQEIRRLITQPQEQIKAKDRSGKLNMHEEPNLQMIAAKIRGQ